MNKRFNRLAEAMLSLCIFVAVVSIFILLVTADATIETFPQRFQVWLAFYAAMFGGPLAGAVYILTDEY